MRVSFRQADFSALAELWNSYYPQEYAIDAAILEQNTVGSPLFDWGASAIDVVDEKILGFVAVKKSAATLYKGPQPDTWHITGLAHHEADTGVDLLAYAKQNLRDRGAYRLAFGGDNRHLFPGCPTAAANLCNFLMVAGFREAAECFDLERDLADYEPPTQPPDGLELRTCKPGDVEQVRTFFEREFPHRWRYDVFDKIGVEGPEACVFGAFQGDRCVGFALIQDAKQRQPIGGAVWRKSLGENWCSLGPIGVSSEMRGGGIGHGLLGKALLELKSRGGRRCIIDWTTLKEFYGKHGFVPTRHYRPATLLLEE